MVGALFLLKCIHVHWLIVILKHLNHVVLKHLILLLLCAFLPASPGFEPQTA